MADQTATAGAENTILVVVTNTSPASLHKIVQRIDRLELGARVVMTVTKNENGVLFWTVQEMGRVER